MADAALLNAFLRRTLRRLTWIAALKGAAVGILVAAVLLAASAAGISRPIAPLLAIGLLVFFAGTGAAVLGARAFHARERVPARLERLVPESRNLLITAFEILSSRLPVRPWMGEAVCREAAGLVGRLDPRRLFPASRTIVLFLGMLAVWVLTLAATRVEVRTLLPRPLGAVEESGIAGIEITIVPPAYSGLAQQTVRDPVRIEALEGSRLDVLVRTAATDVLLETIDGEHAVARDARDTFSANVTVNRDGYLALESRGADGAAGERRLIGISAVVDEPVRVRVTAPGHDLFLPAADRTLDIEVQASDDLAIDRLFLRYTRVSGSGEQFTFVDADLPLHLERSDARNWTGRTSLRLDTLGLEAGDVLVYRGVAMDRAPTHGETESDAFIVEITSPGAVASEGFAMDDEEDRYALSQQMVILRTERLIAAAGGMAADSVLREARVIAAEQRSVRAEFVFMMGGELAEEVEQANLGDLNEADHVEADDEAIAGRLENQGRFALIRAIRSMSRAYAALNNGELASALEEEKRALDQLQDAFARTRYILRALTEREQIDIGRRLSGSLAEAAGDRRPGNAAAPSEQEAALRSALRAIAVMMSAELGAASAETASREAETLLRADPSSAAFQTLASTLIEAAGALREVRVNDARRLLDDVSRRITGLLAAGHGIGTSVEPILEGRRLDGALTDALRSVGR